MKQIQISKTTAMARLRRALAKEGLTVVVNRSAGAKQMYGECMIVNSDNSVTDNGDIERFFEAYGILKKYEEVAK